MVKTTGPLLSVNAHGQLAKTLNYSQRKEGNIGRQFHYPHKEPSQKQYTRRTILGLLTAHWQCMTDAQKLVWENNAKLTDLNISGFNYFVKSAMADLYTHHGLCGYWSFNELTGATAYDYSGNENHGTLKPTYPSDVPSRIDSINKKFGKALSFDGVNDYVSLSNGIVDLSGDCSVDSWVKLSTDAENENPRIVSIIDTDTDNFQSGYLSDTHIDGINRFYIRLFDTTYSTDEMLPKGVWIYLAWTKSDGVQTFYINSIEKTVSLGGITANAAFSGIGAGYTPTSFTINGLIDEVKVYNRALSAAEIMKHYELLRRPNRRQIRLV